jgi:hypothetical protein
MNFDDYQRPHWIAELTAQAACQANEVASQTRATWRGISKTTRVAPTEPLVLAKNPPLLVTAIAMNYGSTTSSSSGTPKPAAQSPQPSDAALGNRQQWEISRLFGSNSPSMNPNPSFSGST